MGFLYTIAAAILSLFLPGCFGPFVPVIDIDHLTAQDLRSEILVIPKEQIKTLQYDRLEAITATSCMNKLLDSVASEEDAIDQLRYKTQLLGGNAIAHLLCEGREGTSLVKNCWTSVTCHGVAVRVSGK